MATKKRDRPLEDEEPSNGPNIRDNEESTFDSLSDEIVSSILNRLPAIDKLSVVPFVCRRWHRLHQDPLCWRSIDLSVWRYNAVCSFRHQHHQQALERLVNALIPRSNGSLLEFSITFTFLPIENLLRFIAERGKFLQKLQILGAIITDECAWDVAPKLQSITELNLFLCNGFSGSGLNAFGLHCQSLTELHITLDDDKCMSIAQHMKQLTYLHARYSKRPSRASFQAIIRNCTRLRAFIFEDPCHEPHMSRTFLKECMRSRDLDADTLYFGCRCCRGYTWDPIGQQLLERRSVIRK